MIDLRGHLYASINRRHPMIGQPVTMRLCSFIKQMLLPLLLSHLACVGAFAASSNEPADTIIHSTDGWSDNQLKYQIALLKAALEESRALYGDYALQLSNTGLSSSRTIWQISNGKISTGFSAGTSVEQETLEVDIERLLLPFMRSLHGLRQCLAHKSNVPELSKITSIERFNRITFGQGVGWAEAQIYPAAGLSLTTASSVDRLLLMLEKKRFECLPLSVLEIDQVLEQANKNNQDLAIVPNLYIFYPNPVFINITKKPKHISYRLIYGVSRLFETGKAEAIFYDNFAQAINFTLPTDAHIFLLDNHLLTPADASKIESYFSAHYLQSPKLNIHNMPSRATP